MSLRVRLHSGTWILFLLPIMAAAQIDFRHSIQPEKTAKHHNRKIRFHTGFGLEWYSDGFYFHASPGLTYALKPRWHVGTGLLYTYYSYRRAQTSVRANLYGFNVLTFWLPTDHVETSFEFRREYLKIKAGKKLSSRNAPALLAGIAYRTRHMAVGLRYDILFREGRSLRRNPAEPFVRIYF